MKFIYVCSEEDKEILLKHGFHLLRGDEKTSFYVFENDETITKDVGELVDVFAYGNTLMF